MKEQTKKYLIWGAILAVAIYLLRSVQITSYSILDYAKYILIGLGLWQLFNPTETGSTFFGLPTWAWILILILIIVLLMGRRR